MTETRVESPRGSQHRKCGGPEYIYVRGAAVVSHWRAALVRENDCVGHRAGPLGSRAKAWSQCSRRCARIDGVAQDVCALRIFLVGAAPLESLMTSWCGYGAGQRVERQTWHAIVLP